MPAQPSRLESLLTESWSRRGLLAHALWPVSLVFGVLSAGRRGLYRHGILSRTRLPVPVLVVGNIFIGGTGKTPLTIWLIDALRRAGFRPGVIARGYGAKAQQVRAVTPDSLARDVGDEPLLIVGRTGAPMTVGRDRVAAAQALLAGHPEVDVIISDDGLQHYQLGRDLEIVLADARGNGNGWLLPAGPLREPATRRRDFSVVNTTQPGAAAAGVFQMQLLGQFAEKLADRRVRVALPDLPPGPKLAAAGIGHPQRFFSLLRAAGLDIAELPLPDHFAFEHDPFADQSAQIILITEKDAVKCRQHPALKSDPRLWVVPVEAQIDAALAEQIVEKLRGFPIA